MTKWWQQGLQSSLPDGGDRGWYAGIAASAAVHVCVIALLAGLSFRTAESLDAPIDTRWGEERQQAPSLQNVRPAQMQVSAESGGRRSDLFAPADRLVSDTQQPVPVPHAAAILPRPDKLLGIEDLSRDAGGLFTDGADASSGNGSGEGNGTGSGEGFFGADVPGRRFVYVLDCSTSMNHPHDSAAKTRFKRLKLELVKSIGSLDSAQEFYIIFFNEGAVPMPAQAPQPAVPKVKQHYLQWMTTIRARGDTDPRDAIKLALRLQPDVIYLLTDGDFDRLSLRDLRKLSQRRAAIHTFAMGNRDGQEILELIAERNGGQYHFVP